jgi:hypothetical protein
MLLELQTLSSLHSHACVYRPPSTSLASFIHKDGRFAGKIIVYIYFLSNSFIARMTLNINPFQHLKVKQGATVLHPPPPHTPHFPLGCSY